jgi:hypothetical protein
MKNDSKVELVKRDDHYGLYDESGQKIAATLDGCKYKLSTENCDEIFGVVDVGKLALEECNNTDPLRLDSQKYKQDPYFRIGYLKGYNKAMELNKDKLFTENDIARAFIQGVYTKDKIHYNKEESIKSIQQPTEIEVEIEQVLVQSSIDGEAIWKYKLDKNGCLILKKK